MKTLRQMKKRTLMSMLFLSVSLAAFAFAPQAWILSWSVTDITSNSAHLVVEHENAQYFELTISKSDGESVGYFRREINSLYPGDIVYSIMDIENLRPNTTYTLKVIVESCRDEVGHFTTDFEYITFTTPSEVQP